MSKLLVVVDYQNDFVDGALGFDKAKTLENGIAAKVRETLAGGGYVLFTRDTHAKNYLQTREGRFLPVEHCIEGTHGHALYGSLAEYEAAPRERCLVLNKPTFGCIDLPAAVRAFCGGEPDEIALCGIVTNICVLSNAVILHSAFLNAGMSVYGALCAAPGEEHGAALALLSGLGIAIL